AAAMDRHDVTLQLLDAQEQTREQTLPLSRLPAGFDERRVPLLAGLNWQFWLQPALVDRLVDDSAARGVLQPGDLIVAVDGNPIDGADQVYPAVQALGKRGGAGMIDVL